jgi:hypothetical protein
MNAAAWWPAVVTLAAIVGYEAWLAWAQRTAPHALARSAHASLREDWFEAVSAHPGTEVLAVQTLRNSLMSASMTASTAVLALMGSITLTAPSLHASLEAAAGGAPVLTPRLAMELVLLLLLFSSLASSVMAVRFYTHAGFIGGMPVQSPSRQRWAGAGRAYVRRAGLLYSWSLRNLLLIAPVVAFMLHPMAGPVAAVVVVSVLSVFDRARSAPSDT